MQCRLEVAAELPVYSISAVAPARRSDGQMRRAAGGLLLPHN